VEAHRDEYRVELMCPLLGLSRSGYYGWRNRPVSARTLENERLTYEIRRIFAEGRGEYGSPTITDVLRQEGFQVNPKRIVRLMRHMGLFSKVVKRFKRTTKRCKDREAAPNLLRQNFTTTGPNRVWLSDITYVRTAEGWLYVTTVMDMWSRRMLGYAITDHLRADGVIEAVKMALEHRRIEPGLVFHSDRGKQYIYAGLRKIFKDRKIVQSMSSTGNCYDNAMAESFFATFKKGHLFWEPFETKEQARRRIIEYLEVFYNCVRRHSSLGHKSPVAYELQQSRLSGQSTLA
jgi:transposase InsO family protein